MKLHHAHRHIQLFDNLLVKGNAEFVIINKNGIKAVIRNNAGSEGGFLPLLALRRGFAAPGRGLRSLASRGGGKPGAPETGHHLAAGGNRNAAPSAAAYHALQESGHSGHQNALGGGGNRGVGNPGMLQPEHLHHQIMLLTLIKALSQRNNVVSMS